MLDFLKISTRTNKNGTVEIYPRFIIKKSEDLMIKGSDFYAIWNESQGLWSTDEQTAVYLIDREIKEFHDKYVESRPMVSTYPMYLWDAETGMIDRFHKYCQKQLRDNFVMLDEELLFADSPVDKKTYSSKRLPYPLVEGSIENYDKIIGTLYSEEERLKIEWSIGSIVHGDSKHIQKFLVLYGSAGTGKSTILNIIQQLFEGYYSVFDAKALGNSNNAFALESFKTNPLVGIQHDGDLSKIEDNTRLNSLVSHELMTVNEKYKSTYGNRFKTFLYMGTNKPVKITEAKSGLIRRLIDVSPSGEKLTVKTYKKCMDAIKFELGAIANHCLQVYEANKGYFDDYIPINMLSASNDFYTFVSDCYFLFKKEDRVTLKRAWELYKTFSEESKMSYLMNRRVFSEELKNYFHEYHERYRMEDNTRIRNMYVGFKTDLLDVDNAPESEEVVKNDICELSFDCNTSIFDDMRKDCLAQLATAEGNPKSKWANVKTKLSQINTSKLHWVKVPENHIVIDFDIKDESGEKSLELNKQAASKWPKTYAELSKSGKGIHLHYIYSGDVSELKNAYDKDIEIKVYSGNASLRRQFTLSNGHPVEIISSGLPRKEKKMVNQDIVVTEKSLRNMIERNINKEFHPGTKPSMDFIKHILDEAYEKGVEYDVSDMFNDLFVFASGSTNQSDYCLKILKELKLLSKTTWEEDTDTQALEQTEDNIHFFDIEVFPNVIFINFKKIGKKEPMQRWINPTPEQVEWLCTLPLVGFNCRGYDNHILYAIMLGMNNQQVYEVSKNLIDPQTSARAKFGAAYNISYTDVYDYCSAGNKMALKKWQLKLHIPHIELGMDWDQPVDESLWAKVSEYCDNDVTSLEEVFFATGGDWLVRKMLAKVTGLSRNDTTNTLTKHLIFGAEKKPQSAFRYRDLSKPVPVVDDEMRDFLMSNDLYDVDKGFDEFSKLPYFKGYKHEYGVSTYRGHKVGEGGWVITHPGIYTNVGLIDVTSEHPYSAMLEYLFGMYTQKFYDLVATRVDIKMKDIESAKKRLGGIFAEFLDDPDINPKAVSNGAKTPINSAYGLTSAAFENPFRDPRNKDNIVAKRGALFMIDLYEAITAKGWTCIHVKTDSVKIADITDEKVEFVHEFGKKYGYKFDYEAHYSQFALFNKACYVAKHSDLPMNKDKAGTWTTTGMPISHPYVKKTLFTKEEMTELDYFELKSAKTPIYLDFNEGLPDVSLFEKELNSRQVIADPNRKVKTLPKLNSAFEHLSNEDLEREIAVGHDYHFVGKNGNFLPVIDGSGGAILCKKGTNGKYASVTGTKGYRWKEADVVLSNNQFDIVNMEYYEEIANGIKESIQKLAAFDLDDDGYQLFYDGLVEFLNEEYVRYA